MNKNSKIKALFAGKNKKKNLVISIVILVELLMIFTIASFAWVETVSSIKIATRNADNNEDPLVVDTYHFTEATIGEGKGTIDLGAYFKQAGDMHFAPTSSADGENMFFPKVTSEGTAYVSSGTQRFRKGDSSDKNTAYMSISFKLKADVNADFFFTQVPTFSQQAANMRVSVTAYTEGMSKGDLYTQTGLPKYTQIYAMSDSVAGATVVGSTSGSAVATSYEAFADHIKGKGSTAKLFSVAADETKIVTINVWLQGSAIDNSLPQDITISNLGIISDLTPRHVTLIPTDRWDLSDTTEYFYAWCWDSSKSGVEDRLYKLTLDENEHYAFDYNGTYRKTLFIRCGNANLTTNDMKSSWSTLGLWNKTADTAIPNTPIDPTYYIQTINGGAYDGDISRNKSTGAWVSPDLVTIKTAYVTGQTTAWGTLTSKSYYGTTVTTSQQVEANNGSNASAKHHDTIHALPGKKVRLTATAKTNYRFVGWYDNAAGTGTALSTSATYDFNASSEAPKEVVYYAKFVETRNLTIYRYLDGASSSTACGTITIDGTNSTSGTSTSKTFDKGTSVSFSATAATGYTLEGIFTTQTGTTSATSPVTLNSNTTYYARYTTNTHTVKLNTIGSTGSTVQYGNETAATSVTKTDVKYNTSVTIKANPAGGYKFVGWYTNSSGTGTAASTSASYTFTLGDADVTYYAKFEVKNQYYLKASWNDWSESQDQLTGTGNELTYTQELDPGEYTFKIYDGAESLHWSNAYEYKYKKSSSTDTYLGATGGDTLNSSTSTGNMQLNVGYTGSFVFHFNRNTNKFWITATDVTTYHVAGSDLTGSWDATNSNKMTKVSTYEYTYSVYVNGNDKEFKIRTNSGTYYGNGYGYHNGYYGAYGGDTLTTSGGNMKMSGNKTYIFHFNSNTKKFWITDS